MAMAGMQIDEHGAAKMYLLSIGGQASSDDAFRLGQLIRMFAEEGWKKSESETREKIAKEVEACDWWDGAAKRHIAGKIRQAG